MPEAAGSLAPRDDWTVRAADTVEAVVSVARDKAVVPATTVSRALVYGLLAAIVASMALVLVAIGFVRLLVAYLPFDPESRRVWVAEAGLGGIFAIAGLLLWSRRGAGD